MSPGTETYRCVICGCINPQGCGCRTKSILEDIFKDIPSMKYRGTNEYNEEIAQLKASRDSALAECEALRGQLATCREKALEEAAQYWDNQPRDDYSATGVAHSLRALAKVKG
jgi:hypothetical protein